MCSYFLGAYCCPNGDDSPICHSTEIKKSSGNESLDTKWIDLAFLTCGKFKIFELIRFIYFEGKLSKSRIFLHVSPVP